MLKCKKEIQNQNHSPSATKWCLFSHISSGYFWQLQMCREVLSMLATKRPNTRLSGQIEVFPLLFVLLSCVCVQSSSPGVVAVLFLMSPPSSHFDVFIAQARADPYQTLGGMKPELCQGLPGRSVGRSVIHFGCCCFGLHSWSADRHFPDMFPHIYTHTRAVRKISELQADMALQNSISLLNIAANLGTNYLS